MQLLKKKYIINEKNEKIAVQLDLKTFQKIEQLIEDYALGKYLEETPSSDILNLNEAKSYYSKLSKSKE